MASRASEMMVQSKGVFDLTCCRQSVGWSVVGQEFSGEVRNTGNWGGGGGGGEVPNVTHSGHS